MMEYKKITPNLIVENVSGALDFYEQVLDFELVMAVPEGSQQVVTARNRDTPLAFAMVRHGPVELMLQSRRSTAEDGPALECSSATEGIALYIEVADVRRLHARLKGKVTLLQDLHPTFYGMDEFYIRECNGYVLGFASPRQESAT